MDIRDLKADELLRCGIDPQMVLALQLRRTLAQLDEGDEEVEPMTSVEGSFPSVFNGNASSIFTDSLNEIRRFARLASCCCAFFHGFDSIDPLAMDALERRLVDKLDLMCEQLQLLGNRLKRGQPIAFKNPVHQVFHMHVLPVSDLFDFYHLRVIRPCQMIAEKYCEETERREKKTKDKEEQRERNKRKQKDEREEEEGRRRDEEEDEEKERHQQEKKERNKRKQEDERGENDEDVPVRRKRSNRGRKRKVAQCEP